MEHTALREATHHLIRVTQLHLSAVIVMFVPFGLLCWNYVTNIMTCCPKKFGLKFGL